MTNDNLVYLLENKIYINLTNLCTNNCVFCIRNIKEDVVGANLFLKSEKISAIEVIKQLKKFENYMNSEVVFCGYGEPLIKFDELIQVAKYIKDNYPNTKIRINTNGQANIIHKRNVIPELAIYIDEVSVSLNGENEEVYNLVSVPSGKNVYEEVKAFIKGCAESGIKTTATVVTGYKDYKVDTKKCEDIAVSLGAAYRERPWLDNGY